MGINGQVIAIIARWASHVLHALPTTIIHAAFIDTKLMITGHSIGGMVARTALLLSNYPNDCPVSDILMLSTPNTR